MTLRDDELAALNVVTAALARERAADAVEDAEAEAAGRGLALLAALLLSPQLPDPPPPDPGPTGPAPGSPSGSYENSGHQLPTDNTGRRV
jgi:hypothetical protein